MRKKSIEYRIRVSAEMSEKIARIAENFNTTNAAINHVLYCGVNSHPSELERLKNQKRIDVNTIMLSTAVVFCAGAITGNFGLILLSFVLGVVGIIYLV